MIDRLGQPVLVGDLLPALPTLATTLAQGASNPSPPAARILLWLAVLGGAAVFLAVTCFFLWKRLNRDDDTPTINTGFTLPELRDLHKACQLTDEEFENAKTMLLARSRAEMDLDDSGEPAPESGGLPR